MTTVTDSSELLDRIIIDPEICHGKPTIRDLRYLVESLLKYLAAGDTTEEILENFPDLEREDLQASILFAARSLKLKSQKFVSGNLSLPPEFEWKSQPMNVRVDLSDKDALYEILE